MVMYAGRLKEKGHDMERAGSSAGAGLRNAYMLYQQQKGNEELQRIMSETPAEEAQTPEMLMKKALEIGNPFARQAAMDQIGKMAPHMKPIALPHASDLVTQSGKPIVTNPKTTTKKNPIKVDVWRKTADGIEKDQMLLDPDNWKETAAKAREQGWAFGTPVDDEAKEFIVSKEIKPGVFQEVKIKNTPKNRKLYAEKAQKGDVIFGQVKGESAARSLSALEFKRADDAVLTLHGVNEFNALDPSSQRKVLDINRRVYELMQSGYGRQQSVDQAMREVYSKEELAALEERKDTHWGLGDNVDETAKALDETQFATPNQALETLVEKKFSPKEIIQIQKKSKTLSGASPTIDIVREYMRMANDNKEKAREMARKDGWSF